MPAGNYFTNPAALFIDDFNINRRDGMDTILIVEDDKAVRNNTEIFLKTEGFGVLTAANGLEALQIIDKSIPDLIISDIVMPYVDGIELYRRIQNQYINNFISFIFLTAKCDLASIREGLNLGVDDYITKPFDFRDLLTSIQNRLLKKKRYDSLIEDLKNTITRNIPHELRTPLTTILGYSSYITHELANLSTEDIAYGVSSIEKAGKRLYDRIEKFLFYASIEDDLHSKMFLNNYTAPSFFVEPIQIENMIQNLFLKYDRIHDMSIEADYAWLNISEEHFQIILTELTDNALKFSNGGTAVSVTGKISNNNYIITISDNGRGMSYEEISLISSFRQFQRNFYQQTGLGIGLYMVKRIIELHEGHINIENPSGNGTKIEIKLKINKQ